jgi:sortase A
VLAYCGFAVADSWNFQREANRRLEELPVPAATKMATADGLIGRIEIARLGVSVIVMEGTNSRTLRRAVGHIAGTALPGQTGNVGIAAHRDTFFRPLRDIRNSDIVMLHTSTGEYRYSVVSTRIVRPDNVAVLEPGAGETLTLVTCYPFYFVGSAPDRFIVRAERVI